MTTKIGIDELERKASAARPGPWAWFGNSKMHSVYLATTHSGRVFVMDFERWGMRGAQPRFQIDHRMVTLGELAKTEHPLGPKFEVPYRRDFAGIAHPDADHIAANDPTTTLALIARIRELEAAVRSCVFGGVIPSSHSIEGERQLIELLEKGAVLP